MSQALKRPAAPGTGRRGSTNPPGTTSSPGISRSPSRASTASNGSTSGSSTVARTSSLRRAAAPTNAARAGARRSVVGPSGLSNDTTAADSGDSQDEESREETLAVIEDLKERLQKAETASEEFQKQLSVLQLRLDETLKEQARLEDKSHEDEERIEGLENDKKDLIRLKRELESIYETERVASMKDKEDSANREDELHSVIQRLKESLSTRELRAGLDDEQPRLSRNSSFRSSGSPSLDGGSHFAPPASLQRSDSRNSSKLLLQKDKVIESLRLEVAEAQIKMAEVENMGGGRLRELEKALLEARMANARLMEDNESFQLLLSEKTLNGDFAKGEFMRTTTNEDRAPSRSGPKTSLADELQSVEEEDSEGNRRWEAEARALKEENKALSLYIEKIIGRLLAHGGYDVILDKSDEASMPPPPPKDKALPPPPPKEAAPSFLQRAKSVAMGTTNRPRPRPLSGVPHTTPNLPTEPPLTTPTPSQDTFTPDVSNPDTAPSVPLGRSPSVRQPSGSNPHRRSASEWAGAGSIVNQMYRGPVPAASGQISPGLASPRHSFFGSIPTTARVPSGGVQTLDSGSGTASTATSEYGSAASTALTSELDTPSPPRSVASNDRVGGGAIMAGKGIRPLRLVQENAETLADEAAAKKANRGSWWGWMGKKGEEGQQGLGRGENVDGGLKRASTMAG